MSVENLKIYENNIYREPTKQEEEEISEIVKLGFARKEDSFIHLCESCPIEQFMKCKKVLTNGKKQLSQFPFIRKGAEFLNNSTYNLKKSTEEKNLLSYYSNSRMMVLECEDYNKAIIKRMSKYNK